MYLTIDQKAIPLAKVKITSTACLFIPGKKPLTKDKFIKLVQNIHGRSIPIYISHNDQKFQFMGYKL
ncbi:hypothetical protein SDC49_12905 [Lactobacillus sp. R2/2]|nr:hypothetical protein [Lactobacillus sp. R2/2]